MDLEKLDKSALVEIVKKYRSVFGELDPSHATQHEFIEKLETFERIKFLEERFRQAFYTSPDSININRASDGLYIDINEGFTNITGFTREDCIGKTSAEINIWDNIEDRNNMVKALREDGFVQNFQANFRMKNGKVVVGLMSARFINLHGEPHILSVTRDIDDLITMQKELKQAQEKLYQMNKLEAMGRVSGIVGHEFKNYLAVIKNYVEVLIAEKTFDEEAINIINSYVEKANKLSSQLLDIGRLSSNDFEDFTSPNDLIINSKTVFKHLAKDRNLILNLEDRVPPVTMSTRALEQILINLIINARDAEAKNITISTNIEGAKYSIIEVIDDGTGIDEEIQTRIFEPFYTSKGDQGNGLGLAIVYGLIKQAGGRIEFESTLGEGTKFCLVLPIAK
ncbi:MAG: PAS domain S-box protein [Candidatus Heimdallarchaeota archaeon]|nr:PAS domain S-box protein [Candidatus Heimdallarchaeota archaeon]